MPKKSLKNKTIEEESLSARGTRKASSPTSYLDMVQDVEPDDNGVISLDQVVKSHPEIKKSFSEVIRDKQKMIINSIQQQDLASASLRDKAVSAKALHEQAMEMETGLPGGSKIELVYIQNGGNLGN